MVIWATSAQVWHLLTLLKAAFIRTLLTVLHVDRDVHAVAMRKGRGCVLGVWPTINPSFLFATAVVVVCASLDHTDVHASTVSRDSHISVGDVGASIITLPVSALQEVTPGSALQEVEGADTDTDTDTSAS